MSLRTMQSTATAKTAYKSDSGLPQAHTGSDALEHVVLPAMREGGDWWTRIEAFVARQRWETPSIESDVYVHIQRHDPMRLCQARMCHAIAADGRRWQWPEPLLKWPADGSKVWVVFDSMHSSQPRVVCAGFERTLLNLLSAGRCHATRKARDQHERALIALSTAAESHA